MDTNHQLESDPNHASSFSVLGLEIDFPFEPYGIQKAMMNHITRALMNRQHSLIESPTGTGKTLVLLCSSLAWQKKSMAQDRPFISSKMINSINADADSESDSMEWLQEEEEETTKRADKRRDENNNKRDKRRIDCIPRIYYGIRTHRQIGQVIHELRKTSYASSTKVCILSGRERTCINEQIRQLPSRDDKCQELVSARRSKRVGACSSKRIKQHETCRFHCDSRTAARAFQELDRNSVSVWDIEDAVEFGRKHSVCPYYGMRALHEQATITFCPYNYLLDPTIRKGMGINLLNSIVIFDEAHNIEDVCRQSASFVVSQKQIVNLTKSLGNLMNFYAKRDQTNIVSGCKFFDQIFKAINKILAETQFNTQLRESFVSYSQADMLTKLESLGLGREYALTLKNHLKNLSNLASVSSDHERMVGEGSSVSGSESSNVGGADASESPRSGRRRAEPRQPPKLDFESARLINQLAITINLMYAVSEESNPMLGEQTSGVRDFRLVLCRFVEQAQTSGVLSRGLAAVGIVCGKLVKEFRLLCMNPAQTFKQIHETAWSVIVASGTLAPIESFKTELGCTFANIFEGSHVVKSKNIFASIIGTGPNNLTLNGCYNNSMQLAFQDELGAVVGDICLIVPNGVLCFFPSYDRMNKLVSRWQGRGLITGVELKSGKHIFREQKGLGANEFEHLLSNYYRCANGPSGALLLAVYRGKVSEGINFADRAARAVITIGIPYPSFGEIGVALKRNYNDIARSTNSNLVSGQAWYEAQAFRALNQALGRCIRHAGDWGAILMLDSRLHSNRSKASITKWIRVNLIEETAYASVLERLRQFVIAHNDDE